VSPITTSTSEEWTWEPASATLDDPDLYTYEFGDDVLTDWFQDGDGILESFEIAGPVGLGPLTATEGWRFGSVKSTGSTDSPVTGTVPTPGLSVAVDDIIVYLKDGAIYISDTPYDLASNQVSDALYSFTLTGEQEVDQKRWANGDQSFDTDAMVPGARTIELECRWAKTADIVGVGSESDDWMSDQPVNRYVRMEFIATTEASVGVFYSFLFEGPMRYYTRVEDEEGGNTVVTLMGRFFYDPNDFGGVFRAVVVNTLSEAELGNAGS
jgi:hypothetical protein